MARTKTVFPTGEIAHLWAHQQTEEGRNPGGNFYFNGRVIYSYGSHFPIAVIDTKDPNLVWLTTRTSSNTTAGHISDVRGAISHMKVIKVSSVPTSGDTKDAYWRKNQIKYWIECIKSHIGGLNKAIKPSSHIEAIKQDQHNLRAFITQLKIRETKDIRTALADPISDEFLPMMVYKPTKQLLKVAGYMRERILTQLAKEPEANARLEAIQEKRRKKQLEDWDKEVAFRNLPWPEKLAKWKAGEVPRLPYSSSNEGRHTYLRLLGKHIETSKGVKVPVEVAHRYYHTIHRVLAKQEETGDCKIKFMEYCVTEITTQHLLVGCHDIPMQEIEEIAIKVGWQVD